MRVVKSHTRPLLLLYACSLIMAIFLVYMGAFQYHHRLLADLEITPDGADLWRIRPRSQPTSSHQSTLAHIHTEKHDGIHVMDRYYSLLASHHFDGSSWPSTARDLHLRPTMNHTHFSTVERQRWLQEQGPIPVLVWPYYEMGEGYAEAIHLERNGVHESPYLSFVKPEPTEAEPFVQPEEAELDGVRNHNLHQQRMANLTARTPNIIWLADTGFPYQWKKWCFELSRRVERALASRRHVWLEQQQQQGPDATTPPFSITWPIYIVDFTDRPNFQRCRRVEDLVGFHSVHYTKRSIVEYRRYDQRTQWIQVGQVVNLQRTYDAVTDKLIHPTQAKSSPNNHTVITYRRASLFVRTDIVELLARILRKQHGLTLQNPIEHLLPRPVDVAYFWPASADERLYIGDISSEFRNRVAELLLQEAQRAKSESNGSVKDVSTNHSQPEIFVGLAGHASRLGRRGAQFEYVEAMLEAKMVVVVQRDDWEDHYRLMEALVSGAMVLMDRMLSLPQGLKNGTSVIEFDSPEELVHYIRYYHQHPEERIAIARAGRWAAMSQHRSWHRVEEIIFGQAMTTCSSNSMSRELTIARQNKSFCPWIVHTDHFLNKN